MEITRANFLKSSQHYPQLPPPARPEFAFVGRSNVGKSSLINMLCKKKLAMTSSTPGKTRLINHYDIDGRWYLVDLPGYGYAKVSKSERVGFENLMRDYILKRPNLVSVFLLIDSRLEPQQSDIEFMEFLGLSEIPFVIVFTKIDKLSKTQLSKNIESYQQELLKSWEELPPIFLTSSEKSTGREELLAYIEENMPYFQKP